jgi:3-deoxy-D-manno-octulosonate 8-phosphate phosphatase (KDO 8-P phosphatase)
MKKMKIPGCAKNIKLIATDVDGVLTDGRIIILDSGEEVKAWDVADRFAFTLLRNFGGHLKIAWITGRKSKQVADRASEVGVHHLYQRCMDKLSAMNEILEKEKIKMSEVAYIGDDLLDLPVLTRCGFSCCPATAVSEVKEAVDYVTAAAGGRGAFREVVEQVLKAQGIWKDVLKKYRS